MPKEDPSKLERAPGEENEEVQGSKQVCAKVRNTAQNCSPGAGRLFRPGAGMTLDCPHRWGRA